MPTNYVYNTCQKYFCLALAIDGELFKVTKDKAHTGKFKKNHEGQSQSQHLLGDSMTLYLPSQKTKMFLLDWHKIIS